MTSTNDYWVRPVGLITKNASQVIILNDRPCKSRNKIIKRNKLLSKLIRLREIKRKALGVSILLPYFLFTFVSVILPLALIDPKGSLGSLLGFAGGLLILLLWLLGYYFIETRFFNRLYKAKHKGKWKTIYDYN